MAEKKMTKKDNLNIIKSLVIGEISMDDVDTEAIVKFCDDEIAHIVRKAEKAAAAAAQKKSENHEFYDVVKSVLTDEFQSCPSITAQIDGDGVTVGKVRAQLSEAVRSGEAIKDTLKTEDGKSVVCYKLA